MGRGWLFGVDRWCKSFSVSFLLLENAYVFITAIISAKISMQDIQEEMKERGNGQAFSLIGEEAGFSLNDDSVWKDSISSVSWVICHPVLLGLPRQIWRI